MAVRFAFQSSNDVKASILIVACVLVATCAVAACSKAKSDCDYQNPSCGDGRVCAFVERDQSRCIAFVDATLDLQPPFKSGQQFWCSQGGKSPRGRTHSFLTHPLVFACSAHVLAGVDFRGFRKVA